MRPIITQITDTDLYKFGTQQYAFARRPDTQVTMTFKCRNEDVSLAPLVSKIEEQLNYLSDLSVTEKEIHFLASMRGAGNVPLFYPAYLNYLKRFKFNSANLIIISDEKDVMIEVTGTWADVTLWEIPILAIVNEIYMGDLAASNGGGMAVREEGMDRLLSSMRYLRDSAPKGFAWTEFGTRRRFSKEWQDTVLDFHLNHATIRTEKFLAGTSNVALAQKYKIPCVGTMPHEYLQSFQAHSPLPRFQYDALLDWITFNKGNLGVALTDVVGMDAFERDFDYLLAKAYDGVRHDSGDPNEWGYQVVKMYEKYGIPSHTKKAIWSDGLDFVTACNLYRRFNSELQCGFGIGTKITNNLGLKPLNIVMKLTEVNGQPVAKLSDSPGKTMCKDETYMAELRRAQGLVK